MSPFKGVGHVQLSICALSDDIGNCASIRLNGNHSRKIVCGDSFSNLALIFAENDLTNCD